MALMSLPLSGLSQNEDQHQAQAARISDWHCCGLCELTMQPVTCSPPSCHSQLSGVIVGVTIYSYTYIHAHLSKELCPSPK